MGGSESENDLLLLGGPERVTKHRSRLTSLFATVALGCAFFAAVSLNLAGRRHHLMALKRSRTTELVLDATCTLPNCDLVNFGTWYHTTDWTCGESAIAFSSGGPPSDTGICGTAGCQPKTLTTGLGPCVKPRSSVMGTRFKSAVDVPYAWHCLEGWKWMQSSQKHGYCYRAGVPSLAAQAGPNNNDGKLVVVWQSQLGTAAGLWPIGSQLLILKGSLNAAGVGATTNKQERVVIKGVANGVINSNKVVKFTVSPPLKNTYPSTSS